MLQREQPSSSTTIMPSSLSNQTNQIVEVNSNEPSASISHHDNEEIGTTSNNVLSSSASASSYTTSTDSNQINSEPPAHQIVHNSNCKYAYNQIMEQVFPPPPSEKADFTIDEDEILLYVTSDEFKSKITMSGGRKKDWKLVLVQFTYHCKLAKLIDSNKQFYNRVTTTQLINRFDRLKEKQKLPNVKKRQQSTSIDDLFPKT